MEQDRFGGAFSEPAGGPPPTPTTPASGTQGRFAAEFNGEEESPADRFSRMVYDRARAGGLRDDEARRIAAAAYTWLRGYAPNLQESYLAGNTDDNALWQFIQAQQAVYADKAIAQQAADFRLAFRAFKANLSAQAVNEMDPDKRIDLELAANALDEDAYLKDYLRVVSAQFGPDGGGPGMFPATDMDTLLSDYLESIEAQVRKDVPDGAGPSASAALWDTVVLAKNQATRRQQFDSDVAFYKDAMDKAIFDERLSPQARQNLAKAWYPFLTQLDRHREAFVSSGLVTPGEYLDPILGNVMKAGTAGTELAGLGGATPLDTVSNILGFPRQQQQVKDRASFQTRAGIAISQSDLPPEVVKRYMESLDTIYDTAISAGMDPGAYLEQLIGLEAGQGKAARQKTLDELTLLNAGQQVTQEKAEQAQGAGITLLQKWGANIGGTSPTFKPGDPDLDAFTSGQGDAQTLGRLIRKTGRYQELAKANPQLAEALINDIINNPVNQAIPGLMESELAKLADGIPGFQTTGFGGGFAEDVQRTLSAAQEAGPAGLKDYLSRGNATMQEYAQLAGIDPGDFNKYTREQLLQMAEDKGNLATAAASPTWQARFGDPYMFGEKQEAALRTKLRADYEQKNSDAMPGTAVQPYSQSDEDAAVQAERETRSAAYGVAQSAANARAFRQREGDLLKSLQGAVDENERERYWQELIGGNQQKYKPLYDQYRQKVTRPGEVKPAKPTRKL